MTSAFRDHGSSSSIDQPGNRSQQLPNRFLNDQYVCFALLDPEFNFIAVNPAYAKAHQKPEGFFPGKNHFDLYPADVRDVFENVRETKKSSRISSHPVASAGQAERDIRYWDWTLEPVLGQKNEVQALVLAETEVTRRVRTEQAFYKSSKILNAIELALKLHDPNAETAETLGALLAEVIDLTESEYGFIGEILCNANGQPRLKIATILDFTQGCEAQATQVAQQQTYLDLTGEDTLPGKVFASGQAVIANETNSETGSLGLPEGHPLLSTFLGIPLKNDENTTGIIGLANCADGYDQSLVDFLQPLLKCYLRLIDSSVAHQERREALTSLVENECLVRELAAPAVENEHRELIGLINECYGEMGDLADTAAIGQHLNKTYSAVARHFQHQEKLMQSIAYPDYEAHKKSHDRFLASFRRNIDRLVIGEDHDVHALQKMLVSWFGRHWSTFDLHVNEYLAN